MKRQTIQSNIPLYWFTYENNSIIMIYLVSSWYIVKYDTYDNKQDKINIIPKESIQQGYEDEFSEKKILDSDCISSKTSVWANCIFFRESDFGCKKKFNTMNLSLSFTSEISSATVWLLYNCTRFQIYFP